MYLRHLISRQTIRNLSRIHGRLQSERNVISENVIAMFSSTFHSSSSKHASTKPYQNPQFRRQIHSSRSTQSSYSEAEPRLDSDDSESEDDAAMNEFLSRFVWIMRKKITEAYPDFDKPTVNGMLHIIAEKVASEIETGGLEKTLDSAAPSPDFSEDLWTTVLEVTNEVLSDMRRAANKEKMRKFLQCEEVKEMTRFAVEIGVRGEMLREMRFKWAREKMEEAEFHDGLDRLRATDDEHKHKHEKTEQEEEEKEEEEEQQQQSSGVCLPKRQGKMKYKIYGLDLSDPKWGEVAEKTRVAGETVWPEEAKPITGKCKIVNEKILCLSEEDDPTPLLAEWVELLQPTRADWNVLLNGLKEKNNPLYLKVAELVLSEDSFQAKVHDYSNLIDTHAREERFGDAERIIEKMKENGVAADLLTATVLLHMYCKSNDIVRAKAAFESLRSHGFQPDSTIYNSMITAFVNSGRPKEGEALLKDMESELIRPSPDIFFALLRCYSDSGDAAGCDRLISAAVSFAGIETGFEAQKLLLKAHVNAGDHKKAREVFQYMTGAGRTPDDECAADMISVYEKSNMLDKAVALVLELEKRPGFGLGVASYAALADWLGRLKLVDEVEQLLGKISEMGEAPPLKLHVGLCDMYSRAGFEKKALQALGVLESRKDELGSAEFERVVKGLEVGGFVNHARRMKDLMESRGFAPSEPPKTETLGLKKNWIG